MLRYLVKSPARRQLLQLLWGEGARGSVAELAKSVGAAVSTFSRELNAMVREGAARMVREDGTTVYESDPTYYGASILQELVKVRPKRRRKDARAVTVKAWLKLAGAPLHAKSTNKPAPELPELLVEGVRLSRIDSTLTRPLAVAFWRNRDALNARELLVYAKRPEDKHAVGFFVELAGVLGRDRRLVGVAESFRDERVKATRPFFLKADAQSEAQAEERTPPLARSWGFVMNQPMSDFEDMFDKATA